MAGTFAGMELGGRQTLAITAFFTIKVLQRAGEALPTERPMDGTKNGTSAGSLFC
jgi:hypothetical protein